MKKAYKVNDPNNVLKLDSSVVGCNCGPCADLVPKFTTATEIGGGDHTLTATDATTYPAGDGEDKQYFYASQDGVTIKTIENSPAVFDLLEEDENSKPIFDLNKELTIKMKVVSDNACIDDISIKLSSATLQVNGATATAQYKN